MTLIEISKDEFEKHFCLDYEFEKHFCLDY